MSHSAINFVNALKPLERPILLATLEEIFGAFVNSTEVRFILRTHGGLTLSSVSSVPALYKRANWLQRCGRHGGYTAVELSPWRSAIGENNRSNQRDYSLKCSLIVVSNFEVGKYAMNESRRDLVRV